MIPATVQQLAIMLLLVLPGVFYQAARERLRGPVPADQEAGSRLLHAIAAGCLLDTVYAIAAGPWLVHLAAGKNPGALVGLAEHARQAGLTGLFLIIIVPTLAAWGETKIETRRRRARYDPIPTAWDALFTNRGPCFVRARMKSGVWVGGWYGTASRASAYPLAADLLLQSQYTMKPDGTFISKIPNTAVYLKGADIDVLEFIEAPQT